MNEQEALARRKRINKMKKNILLFCLVLILIPIIVCIILLVKVNNLENKLNKITNGLANGTMKIVETEQGIQVVNIASVNVSSKEIVAQRPVDIQENTTEPITTKKETALKEEQKKKVYLTFDDGPSENTEEILSFLKKYDVKATFFVVGKEDENSLLLYNKILKEGHTLGMHSYSHDYQYLYSSIKNFKKDFKKLQNLLLETTGQKVTLFRFPGGSSTTRNNVDIREYIRYANKQGYTYFDWNVCAEDAVGTPKTADQIIENVMKDAVNYNESVVLLHDAADKDETVKALPTIIKKLKNAGYEICAIDDTVEPVQHVKASSVKE